MPRYYRRRRGSIMPLVVLLIIAAVLLILVSNGEVSLKLPNVPDLHLNLPHISLPPVPNITIPITGLPEIKIPEVSIPVTVEPGTLIPGIVIGGTPAPSGGSAPASFGARTKTSGCQVQGSLPDHACTPGSVLNVTSNQVCQVGYASSVRDVPESVANQVYAEYGITSHGPAQFEVDHLVPLELGGSNDISNLWAQPAIPSPGFPQKDMVENFLHDQVCSGKMSLADAQRSIATNWVTVFNQMPK